MKSKFIIAVALTSLIGVTSTASAQEATVNFQGVNYVSVEQMASKYNANFNQGVHEHTLTAESVNVILPKVPTRNFYLNGEKYLATKAPIIKDSKYYITAKDWANLFQMMLTHVNGVSIMVSAKDKVPNLTDGTITNGVYRVGKDWGNEKPVTMHRNPTPVHVKTASLDVPIYFQDNKNDLEDVEQR